MSERLRAVLGSVVFLFVAPGVVAGVIPGAISGWQFGPALLGLEPLRWIGGLLLTLGNIIVGLPILPLNALFTIIAIRWTVDSIAPLVRKQELLFWAVAAGLVVLFTPTDHLAEYGSLGLIFGIFGWLVRNVATVENGARKKVQYAIFAFLAFIGVQQWGPMGFGFSVPQFCVMTFCTAITCVALFYFRSVTYPGFAKAGRPVVWLTKFMGRNTLEIYVVHLLLFKLVILCLYPHNFLKTGLFVSHADWSTPAVVQHDK